MFHLFFLDFSNFFIASSNFVSIVSHTVTSVTKPSRMTSVHAFPLKIIIMSFIPEMYKTCGLNPEIHKIL